MPRRRGAIDSGVGRRVRALRLRRGMTQNQLAGADFSSGFVSLVETGRSHLSVRTARIVARRLGVPLGVLLGEPLKSATDIEGSLRLALNHAVRLEQLARAASAQLKTALFDLHHPGGQARAFKAVRDSSLERRRPLGSTGLGCS